MSFHKVAIFFSRVETIGEKNYKDIGNALLLITSLYFLGLLTLRDTEVGSEFSQSRLYALTLVLINSKYSSISKSDL